jgi:hypothetical protein
VSTAALHRYTFSARSASSAPQRHPDIGAGQAVADSHGAHEGDPRQQRPLPARLDLRDLPGGRRQGGGQRIHAHRGGRARGEPQAGEGMPLLAGGRRDRRRSRVAQTRTLCGTSMK